LLNNLGEGEEVRIKEDEIHKGERRFCFMARKGFSNKNEKEMEGTLMNSITFGMEGRDVVD
jgi:hypothetical protein